MRVVREHSGEYVRQTVYVTGGQVFTRKCKDGTWDVTWSDEGEVSYENYALGKIYGGDSAGKFCKLAEVKGMQNINNAIISVFLIDITTSATSGNCHDLGYLKIRSRCTNANTPTYTFTAEFTRLTNYLSLGEVKVYGDTSTGVAYVYAYSPSSNNYYYGHLGARCILVTDLYRRRPIGSYVTFTGEPVVEQNAPSYTEVTLSTTRLLNSGDVTSTYSATGTAPVNGTAVASAISGKVTTYSLGTTQNTENYTMFARMSSTNAQGNGEASFIVSAAGNIGGDGQGVWLVTISNRGSTPTMLVKSLQPIGRLGTGPTFGYYTDSGNGYFYFGMFTPNYRGKCDIIVLTNSGATCQDFGDTTTAPTGWTTVKQVNSYGVNNIGYHRTDALNPSYGLIADVDAPESSSTNQDVCVQFHFSVTENSGASYDYGIAYVDIRQNSQGSYQYKVLFIRENVTNSATNTLKFYWDATKHRIKIYGYSTAAQYVGISLSVFKCTNYSGAPRDPERYVTLFSSAGTTTAPSGYTEITPTTAFIPRTTTNAVVGGAGVPVYVKAGGEIAACTPSSMSVGNATTATNANNAKVTKDTANTIYLAGVKDDPGTSGANKPLYTDTGIFATSTAGQLQATSYKVTASATMQYNSTDAAVEFVFN